MGTAKFVTSPLTVGTSRFGVQAELAAWTIIVTFTVRTAAAENW
jgi:hypothetical protein